MIYIQDAHDSLEAQENIAKLIHYFVGHYGVRTVFEEGYEGPVPTDEYFGFIKDPHIKEKVSYFLMDKLRIGGAEYAHINRFNPPHFNPLPPAGGEGRVRGDFNLIGADNIKLHLENIEWYRKNAQHQEETEKDLLALSKEIDKLANRYFPKELKEWMKLKKRFNEKQIPLLDYLKRTTALVPSLRASRSEVKQSRGFEIASSPPAPRNDVAYPNINLLLQAGHTPERETLEKVKSLDPKTLFEEIDRLENDFENSFLSKKRDRQVFQYHKALDLLKRLNAIEITPAEYEALKTTLQSLDTQTLAQFFVQQTKKSIVLSKRWEENIQDAIRFYEISQTRDEAIEKALTREADLVKRKAQEDLRDTLYSSRFTPPAILVFGGFHKDRIKEILQKEGYSFLIVSPKITQIDPRHQGYYKRLMSVGYHAFESPFLAATASRPRPLIGLPRSEVRSEIQAIYEGVLRFRNAPLPTLLSELERELTKTSRAGVRAIKTGAENQLPRAEIGKDRIRNEDFPGSRFSERGTISRRAEVRSFSWAVPPDFPENFSDFIQAWKKWSSKEKSIYELAGQRLTRNSIRLNFRAGYPPKYYKETLIFKKVSKRLIRIILTFVDEETGAKRKTTFDFSYGDRPKLRIITLVRTPLMKIDRQSRMVVTHPDHPQILDKIDWWHEKFRLHLFLPPSASARDVYSFFHQELDWTYSRIGIEVTDHRAEVRKKDRLMEDFESVAVEDRNVSSQRAFVSLVQKPSDSVSDMFRNGGVNRRVNDPREGRGEKIQKVPVPSQNNRLPGLSQGNDLPILGPKGRMGDLMTGRGKKVFGMARDIFVKEEEHRKLGFGEGDKFTVLELLSGVMERSLDMLRRETGKILLGGDLTYGNSRLEQFENFPDGDARASKTGLTVAYFWVHLYQLFKRILGVFFHWKAPFAGKDVNTLFSERQGHPLAFKKPFPLSLRAEVRESPAEPEGLKPEARRQRGKRSFRQASGVGPPASLRRAEVRKIDRAMVSLFARPETANRFQEKYAVVVDMKVFDALSSEQRSEFYKLMAHYQDGERVKFVFPVMGDRQMDTVWEELNDRKAQFGNVEIPINPGDFDFQGRKVIHVSKEGIQGFYAALVEEKLRGSKDFYSVRYKQGTKEPGLLTAALLLLDSGKNEFFQGRSFSDIPQGLGLEYQIQAILGAYIHVGRSA